MNNIKLCSGYGKYHTDLNKPLISLGWDDITALVDNPQEIEKAHAQWVILSTHLARAKESQELNGEFWAFWLDIDKNPPPINEVADLIETITGGCRYEVYTSKSATIDTPKSRVLIPLARALTPNEWRTCEEVLNDKLADAGITPDRSSEGIQQLCFLPNKGKHYEKKSNRLGAFFEPLTALSKEIAAKDADQAAKELAIVEVKRLAVLKRSERLTQGFKSPIEAFNAAYLVEEVLVQAGYDQDGDKFRHPNSESGSFSASVQNGRVHSLSSADPLYTCGGGVGAHDAFSAFTVLYHYGDEKKAIINACNTWIKGWKQEKEMGSNLAGFEDITRHNHSGQETSLMALPTPYTLPLPVKKPFKLTSIGELMKQPPPTKWLIKGYLPPEGLGFLIAPPAAGKTFLAIDWFCHIACGLPWWGKSVKEGGVVVIAGEGHYGLRRRLKAWGINKGIDMSDKPIVVSEVAASLMKEDSVKAVIEAIDLSLTQLESVDIIVIDTLHRNLGGDENSSLDMGFYFTYLDELRAKYGCFILTVHHTGHGVQDRARGSSSIKAAIDVEYIVSKSGEDANVSCQKMKDGEKPKDFGFTLSEVTLPWLDDEGEAETSAVVVVSAAAASSGKEKQLSAQVMVVFKALCILTIEARNEAEAEEADEWMMVDMEIENAAWKEQTYTKLIQENEGTKQKAFNRGKKALTEAGFVDVENDKYSINTLSLSSQTSAILVGVSGQLSANKIMY